MRSVRRVGLIGGMMASVLASCGTPTHSMIDGATDAAASDVPIAPDVPIPPARTFTFVIDQLTIDPTDTPDVRHTGFNLDDFFSTDIDPLGCTHPDYYSAYDSDQNCSAVSNERCTVPVGCSPSDPGCLGGVDNQFPTLANTIQTAANFDIRAGLQSDATENRLSLLVRVTGVNDLANDDSVRVALYRGYPTFNTGCGSVTAGREYAIDRSYVTPGSTDIDDGALVVFDGRITGGRLRTVRGLSMGTLDLPLDLRGLVLHVPLHQVQFRADIASDSLSNGSLGGWASGNDFIGNCSGPDCVAVMRGVIGGLVDVAVNGVCDGSSMTPPTFGGISFGVGAHAVPATIAPVIVGGPPAGTCGSWTSSDGGLRG